MDKSDWQKAVEFHGHACPGLAIGFKAVEAVKEKMGVTFSSDEELVCVTENDACGVDAIQVLTGCSLGKGNLIYRDTGCPGGYGQSHRQTGQDGKSHQDGG